MEKFYSTVIAFLLVFGIYISFMTARRLDDMNKRMDRANQEYQIVPTDDSAIMVFDRNRYVGTVQLQGELDSLIIKDNE